MDADLKNLQIDRSSRRSRGPSKWATAWIVIGVLLLAGLGAWELLSAKLNASPVVEVRRVTAVSAASAPEGVILNATGYIVAAHKDRAGRQSGRQGELDLDEAMHGSRPEEIAQALANLDSAKADLENARVNLDRARNTLRDHVGSQQTVDDAVGRYDSAVHKVNALQKAYELVKLGPRQEEIDSLRGQVEQAKGALAYAETNLANTVIRAPVTGTILERAVEKGEFVTTSFVGDRGAKGYVVSIADLNDLEVELDISQNDFAKLHSGQHGTVTTDAFPDLKYDGYIKEISPEANRQKATVQIKVKVLKPDSHLRPEMNASVAFLAEKNSNADAGTARPVVIVPASAVKEGAVFVVFEGKAVRRAVKTGSTSGQGVRIEEGLTGGEDLIVTPPPGLKDGDKVRTKA